ncbi:acyl-CoA thioesterase [Amycolatopsis anabasis]|uniref:acyl-CoA thioesterase n=1 Tax=Amycolatopsis anabasis TaxID=1840409 RepID=UPI00131E7981|nr:acyl-CoA thioesterase [Amycolatopsis anabasis]
MPFAVTLTVRLSDLDTNWHVRGPAYLDYADHARWECVRAAGVSLDELARRRIGPVNLETTCKFRSELRPGDEFVVSTEFAYSQAKTSRASQEIHRADGTLVAEITSVSGLLDLDARRLLPDPASYWRTLATKPELLGVTPT